MKNNVPLPKWIFLIGAAGFAAGFIGPMILVPSANQGPMLGIFITGPGGALLGLLAGVTTRIFAVDFARQEKILKGLAGGLAACTLLGLLFNR